MSARTFPPGPLARPLVGNLIEMTRDPLAFLTHCAREYGDLARYRIANVNVFFLNHPDHIKYVLADHNRDFIKGRMLRANRVLLGNGLTTSEGEFWLRQRRLIQPAFHRQRIAAYAETMVAYAERLGAAWREGATFDLHAEMNRLAQQIAAKTLFDADIGGEAEEIGRAFQICLEAFQTRSRTAFLIPTRVPLPGNLRLRRAIHRLDAIIYAIIRERRARESPRGDLLSRLLSARDEEGNALSDRQLRDEVMTIFLAGHDPVGVGLTWTIYLLAQNPTAAQNLRAELSAVLNGRAPRAEDLPRLRYTEMVVKESLRLYPPIWGIVRSALRDGDMGGFEIRAGDSVSMSQWVMHRDARYFEDPDRFVPERWATERMKNLPRFAYFPFGGGPRVCIGDSFALIELSLVVATLAQRFHFTLQDARPVELFPAITLHPKNGIKVTVRRRE